MVADVSEAAPGWRVTNTTKAPAGGTWLALVTLTHGRHDGTTLHVARVDTTGKVWLPSGVPAAHRAVVAPAVAKAALALLGEGRT